MCSVFLQGFTAARASVSSGRENVFGMSVEQAASMQDNLEDFGHLLADRCI